MKTRTTEDRLSEAHRLAGQAVGRLSLSLTVRRLSRDELTMCVRLLDEAGQELRSLLGVES